MNDEQMLPSEPDDAPVQEPRLWRDKGWTAVVLKNEDDDGWAVAMTRDGEAEPALVGPWTMGRDKKNPKPLDAAAFGTLVKTASEVIRRHEQHLHATLHKQVVIFQDGEALTICLDITPDDEHPSATLSARNEADEELARVSVAPGFRLDRSSATAWVAAGFERPGRGRD